MQASYTTWGSVPWRRSLVFGSFTSSKYQHANDLLFLSTTVLTLWTHVMPDSRLIQFKLHDPQNHVRHFLVHLHLNKYCVSPFLTNAPKNANHLKRKNRQIFITSGSNISIVSFRGSVIRIYRS